MIINMANYIKRIEEKQREIYHETNKLLREFHGNSLVRKFIHDCNDHMSKRRLIAYVADPYKINTFKYTDREVKEFFLEFLPKFPVEHYRRYCVFIRDKGYFKLTFQFDNTDKTYTYKYKENVNYDDSDPIMDGKYRKIQ